MRCVLLSQGSTYVLVHFFLRTYYTMYNYHQLRHLFVCFQVLSWRMNMPVRKQIICSSNDVTCPAILGLSSSLLIHCPISQPTNQSIYRLCATRSKHIWLWVRLMDWYASSAPIRPEKKYYSRFSRWDLSWWMTHDIYKSQSIYLTPIWNQGGID